MERAMWCTCVNGSQGAKCQMRKLWEKKKKSKSRKIKENCGDDMRHGGGKLGEVSPTLIKLVE